MNGLQKATTSEMNIGLLLIEIFERRLIYMIMAT